MDDRDVVLFLLAESKTAHIEKTKGGCTDKCPKCLFYKQVEIDLKERGSDD